jgi:hypothetical protein
VERVSQHAAKFNRTLVELSEKLAAHDIVVSILRADWADCGAWELQAQRGSDADCYQEAARLDPAHTNPPDVVRLPWDGRDGYPTIEA